MMLVIASKNCYVSAGRILCYERKEFFAFLSSAAGFFHFADLLRGWFEGELVIISKEATGSTLIANIWSILIAMLLGFAIGVIFYTSAQFMVLHQIKVIRKNA